ncbi:MAG TPA: M1 family peptidase, partial [Flavisolibacter sp.]|nr:M1 family peptidase [Flavisolibacter sp.]
MQKLCFCLILIFSYQAGYSQYWQQQVDYSIKVSLNDAEKSLDGFETLTYTNKSPDSLSFIWFHIWPNAYKNDKTAFSDQLLKTGNTHFYFSSKEERGYLNRLDFKVNGITAKAEDHPSFIDIVKLVLPKLLLPGDSITITTPFHVKLHFNFSRGGYDGNMFQITQWYPKPAVYDQNGWHPMPYLDQGEFYSEFGNFEVEITVPESFVVAATGELQSEKEKEWLQKRQPLPHVKQRKMAPSKAKTNGKQLKNNRGTLVAKEHVPTKTIRFRQENCHDFAWFASPDYKVVRDTCQLTSSKI